MEVMALQDVELSQVALDDLIRSLGPSPAPCDMGMAPSLAAFPPPSPPTHCPSPTAPFSPRPSALPLDASRKQGRRPSQAEELMDHDANGLPVAVDEETRKARKMARNRRAAAVSRERKKQRVDVLEDQVKQLQQENAQLKHKLAMAGCGSETSETTSDMEWGLLSQQPEVFWTPYAPLMKVCTPPPFLALRRLLALLATICLTALCRPRCSPSSSRSTPHEKADVPMTTPCSPCSMPHSVISLPIRVTCRSARHRRCQRGSRIRRCSLISSRPQGAASDAGCSF